MMIFLDCAPKLSQSLGFYFGVQETEVKVGGIFWATLWLSNNEACLG